MRAVVFAVGLLALLAGGPAVAQGDNDIPEGPGRDDVLAWCSGCHAMALVVQQGMSRERWDETITWMVENHNMPAPSDAERKVLLDYLATHYNESRGGKGCVQTPWGMRCS